MRATGKIKPEKLKRLAEAYFRQCDADGKSVTIGGFCRALDITLETLRAWSELRNRADSTQKYAFLDRFWTRYFAAAEADLDEKETQTAAKFKLERLMPLFERQMPAETDDGIAIRFDEQVEPYSR